MKNYPEKVRKALKTLIDDMGQSAWLYVKNPQRDFSRSRKLPFETLLALLLSMGGGTLTKELLDYFKCSGETASSSAFVQQRDKLLSEALEFLLHALTEACAQEKRNRGYRLLAIDGSDVQIPTNPADPDPTSPARKRSQITTCCTWTPSMICAAICMWISSSTANAPTAKTRP